LWCRGDAGTLSVGHRLSPSIRLVRTTDRGGRWPPVKATIYLQKIRGTIRRSLPNAKEV
jgi:hypothetical protein